MCITGVGVGAGVFVGIGVNICGEKVARAVGDGKMIASDAGVGVGPLTTWPPQAVDPIKLSSAIAPRKRLVTIYSQFITTASFDFVLRTLRLRFAQGVQNFAQDAFSVSANYG